MKAKIKKTDEIVNIADYATIALDIHDSWGNPIELKPEEIELIQETTEDEHWQDVWSIEIDSLEDLIALGKKCECGLVLGFMNDEEYINHITIYDDYIE